MCGSLRSPHPTQNLMPPTPIAVAVVRYDGKFLIGRRPEGVPLAGLWEFPGGKVHAGETPEAAAVFRARGMTPG